MSLRSFSRHWGCRVADDILYSGMPLVVMENELVRVAVLPEHGAEIAELRYKPLDIDPLFHRTPSRSAPRYPATAPDPAGSFLDTYAGGWQEIFPSGGGPCQVKGAVLGAHGEVFQQPWQWDILKDETDLVEIHFQVCTLRTPFRLERIMRLEAGSPTLVLEEQLTNLSGETMPFMWGHHPAFGAPFLDDSCVIDAPAEGVEVHCGELSSANRLAPGSTGSWPITAGSNGQPLDMRLLPPLDQSAVDMFYLTGLRAGWAAITNPRLGLGVGLSWDPALFSSIWIWEELRGSRGYPWYGNTYALAVEPFTSYATSAGSGLEEVMRVGRACWLEPGASLRTSLRIFFYPAANARGVAEITPEGVVKLC